MHAEEGVIDWTRLSAIVSTEALSEASMRAAHPRGERQRGERLMTQLEVNSGTQTGLPGFQSLSVLN